MSRINDVVMYLLALTALVCTPFHTAGQSAIPPTAVSGSQEAMATSAAVSPNTGVISYSVPLLTVKDNDLSVDLSANYSSEGNIIADPGGHIGYGWHLNLGGSLTRQIRGLPDDADKGWFEGDGDLSDDSQTRLQTFIEGERDSEPDLYRWHAGPYSGQFIVDVLPTGTHGIVQIPQTDCKIEPTWNGGLASVDVDGFRVTTPEGVTYTFGGFREGPGYKVMLTALDVYNDLPDWDDSYRLRLTGGGTAYKDFFPSRYELSSIKDRRGYEIRYLYSTSYEDDDNYPDWHSQKQDHTNMDMDENDPDTYPSINTFMSSRTASLRLVTILAGSERIDFSWKRYKFDLERRILDKITKNSGLEGTNVSFIYKDFQSVVRDPTYNYKAGSPVRSSKPALSKVIHHGSGFSTGNPNTTPPHYSFEYNDLSSNVYAYPGFTGSLPDNVGQNGSVRVEWSDYMGFAADKNEWFGIPQTRANGPRFPYYGSGDVNAVHQESRKTLLSKITTPLGGTINVAYEPHSYEEFTEAESLTEIHCEGGPIPANPNQEDNYGNNSSSTQDFGRSNSTTESCYDLPIVKNGSSTFGLSDTYMNEAYAVFELLSSTPVKAKIELRGISANNSSITGSFSLDNAGIRTGNGDIYDRTSRVSVRMMLGLGVNREDLIGNYSYTLKAEAYTQDVPASATVRVRILTTIGSETTDLPGSRAKSITTFDGFNTSATSTTYTYEDINGQTYSSGVSFGRPRFGGSGVGFRPGYNSAIGPLSTAHMRFHNGAHVYYHTINNYTPGIGTETMRFQSPINRTYREDIAIAYHHRWFDRNHDYLIRKEYYADGNDTPYQTTDYEYDDGYIVSNATAKGYYVEYDAGGNLRAKGYKIPLTKRQFPTKITQTIDGRVVVKEQTSTAGLQSPLASEEITQYPDGTEKKQWFHRTLNYSQSQTTGAELSRVNISTPVWRSYTFKDNRVRSIDINTYYIYDKTSGKITSSTNSNSAVLPGYLRHYSYLHSDDDDFGATSTRSNLRVVAKVNKVDFKFRPISIREHGRTAITKLSYNSDDLLDEYRIGDAVTSYAYHNRLLSSETDPRGITTSYLYDPHNRLTRTSSCDGSEIRYRRNTDNLKAQQGSFYSLETTAKATASGKPQISVETLDGFGRSIQNLALGSSRTSPDAGANGNGAILFQTFYNALGRKVREVQPITVSGTSINSNGRQRANSISQARFTDYTYEPTKRGRLLTAQLNNGFTTTYDYGYSHSYEASAGGYPAGFSANQLSSVKVTDAGGHTLESLVDSWGNPIVKREYHQGSNTVAKDVRYGYDVQGDLRRIYPFAGASDADNTTYQYKYDHFSQLIEKIVPGKDEELMKYNSNGQLVSFQDFYARNDPNGERYWAFEYDEYGNGIASGVNGGAFAYPSNGIESVLNETIFDHGIGSISFGQAMADRSSILQTSQVLETAYAFDRGADPCGRLVGQDVQSTLHLSSSPAAFQKRLMYDANGNILTTTVDWRAGTHAVKEVMTPKYSADLVLDQLDYQLNIGPLSSSPALRYNGTLHGVEYNIHGQLSQQLIDREGTSDSWLQHIDFAFDNIGRLTAINQPLTGSTSELLTGDVNGAVPNQPTPYSYVNSNYNQSDRDIFFEQISYTSRQHGVSSEFTPGSALHTSLIRQTIKQTKGRYPVVESYDYDGYLRLERFEARETFAANGNLYNGASNLHGEAEYAYDDYGRPTNIIRDSWLSATPTGRMFYREVDDLSYNYVTPSGHPKGPQVRKITDVNQSNHLIEGHKQTATGVSDLYIYNANGDILEDPYRNLKYTYNILGKVRKIEPLTGSGPIIEYYYSADGQLREHKRHNLSGMLVEHIYYIEGARVDVAADDVYLPTDVGAMQIAPDHSVKPIFYHSDHLGNIMMAYHDANDDGVVDTDTELLEESRYYPYGMKLRPYRSYQTEDIPFAFNGAEELQAFDNLHITQFRTMGPETALWGQVDPKAEAMYGMSPYSSMGGNPISYADPQGDLPFLAVVGIGAILGGQINAIKTAVNGGDLGDVAGAWFKGVAVGGAAGAAGYGAGTLFAPLVGNTGFIAGAINGAAGGAASGFTGGAGEVWINGGSFQEGLRAGGQGAKFGAITGGAFGGVSGGIQATKHGRNFWTGNAKQFTPTPAAYASSEAGGRMFEENYTVYNGSDEIAYYKPEDGLYGIKNSIKPNSAINVPVDGVATSLYQDQVFKVPGKLWYNPRVGIWKGGHAAMYLDNNDIFLHPFTNGGWKTLNQLDPSWSRLFDLARTIR